MLTELNGEFVVQPSKDGDGIQCSDGGEYVLMNTIVDLSKCDLKDIDEALGVTRGAYGQAVNCRFSGAGKVCLCGCGDSEWEHRERGKIFRFINCTFENGGRRFPEVQSGMTVYLIDCKIKNWGVKERFDTRSFAVWAHHGGKIYMRGCKFEQKGFWQGGFFNFFVDLANHLGQAVNYGGIRELFKWRNWIPGVCRGAMADFGGEIYAEGCTKNKWWIRIEGQSYDR